MLQAKALLITVLSLGITSLAYGDRDKNRDDDREVGCSIPGHVVNHIQSQLAVIVQQNNGGIFSPNRMWSAVVDRHGVLCSVIKIGDAWPGSRSIAIAKASTANDFSNDALAL